MADYTREEAPTRVLVVDDQESIRVLLRTLCRKEGYEVETAEDGMGAIALLEEASFDVSILDLYLPDIHGLDVLRRAKEIHPDIQVIILTGYSDLETAVEALRLGAYDYLQKPLADLDIIPLTIGRAVDRQNLNRHNERLLRELTQANEELERRRRQQFEMIGHIGHALTGALQDQQVAQVLVEAILGSIACDGVGVLVLPRDDDAEPLTVVDGVAGLSGEARKTLLAAMMGELPEAHDRLGVSAVPESAADRGLDGDDGPWGLIETQQLRGHRELLGVVGLARYDDTPLTVEGSSILDILTSQGSIALENAYLFRRMRELATRDSLTGLYNHGHFFELLAAEISRAERHCHEVGVIMLDIDRATGLKRINDTYGHQAGDRLLREVAQMLQENVRQADVVARYGGDEFVILAPQTGRRHGLCLARRLREKLAEMTFAMDGQEERISASLGVGIYHPGSDDTADSVVSMADQGVYLAKSRGGDQVAMVGGE